MIKIMSLDNQEPQNNQEIEEIEEQEIPQDPRLVKAVERMTKEATTIGLKKEALKGKSIEEQYDLLDFYLENTPKVRKRNQPVVPGVITDNYNPKQYENFTKTGNGIKWEIPFHQLWKKQ